MAEASLPLCCLPMKEDRMLPDFFQFHSPTKVIYAPGIAMDFAHELKSLGCEKYFVVSDGIISGLGLVQNIVDGLTAEGITITGEFLEVGQDAELQNVNAIAAQAKASGAGGLIAIGGGSVIDATKAANIIFSMGGDLVEDFSGAHLLTEPINPFVAIPTTAGTGSEVTFVSMIYDSENKTKMAFADKFSLPDLAVLDPELTVSMPPGLTASTGMDALTHAIEAYVGIDWSPISNAFAVAAIELIFKYLPMAVENGEDVEPRGGMLTAANLAGTAFSHSMVGVVHGMAHATGGLYRVPHGVANGILLAHGMEYNFEEIKEQLARLAPHMGENVNGLSQDEAAGKSIEAVRKLTGKLNALKALPLKLSEVGVPKDGLSKIAAATLEDGTCVYNPREVEEEEVLKHLENAF